MASRAAVHTRFLKANKNLHFRGAKPSKSDFRTIAKKLCAVENGANKLIN